MTQRPPEDDGSVHVNDQAYLASEYYSPADSNMQVFQVLGRDQSTGECRAVNMDTGALKIIDVDELVKVERDSYDPDAD